MTFEEYEHTISTHWFAALVNSDYSGLTDSDCVELDRWVRGNMPPGASLAIIPESDNFAIDEVSGLLASVERVAVLVPSDIAE